MIYSWFLFYLLIIKILGHRNEPLAECNPIDIDRERLEKMTNKEQDDFVNNFLI